MQSDTVIGIVGAVVLVAVMVGVFAYEYNNTPDDGGDGNGEDMTDAERMAAFNATYPSLSASDDIDGDGAANWEDDDIDGDGLNNTADDTVEVVLDLSGTAGAHTNAMGTGPADTTDFFAGEGHTSIRIEVSYATGGTGPVPGQQRLGMEAGELGSATDSGGSGTLELEGVVDPATLTLEVYQTQANPNAVDYAGTITVTYA